MNPIPNRKGRVAVGIALTLLILQSVIGNRQLLARPPLAGVALSEKGSNWADGYLNLTSATVQVRAGTQSLEAVNYQQLTGGVAVAGGSVPTNDAAYLAAITSTVNSTSITWTRDGRNVTGDVVWSSNPSNSLFTTKVTTNSELVLLTLGDASGLTNPPASWTNGFVTGNGYTNTIGTAGGFTIVVTNGLVESLSYAPGLYSGGNSGLASDVMWSLNPSNALFAGKADLSNVTQQVTVSNLFASGTISGAVLQAGTSATVGGSNVVLEGQAVSTLTDDGTYLSPSDNLDARLITNTPAGSGIYSNPVLFGSSGSITGTPAGLNFDVAAGRLNIGSLSNQQSLLQMIGSNGVNALLRRYDPANGQYNLVILRMQKGVGSFGAVSNVTDGYALGQTVFAGTTNQTANAAGTFVDLADVSGYSRGNGAGGYLVFSTKSTNNSVYATRWMIDHDGHLTGLQGTERLTVRSNLAVNVNATVAGLFQQADAIGGNANGSLYQIWEASGRANFANIESLKYFSNIITASNNTFNVRILSKGRDTNVAAFARLGDSLYVEGIYGDNAMPVRGMMWNINSLFKVETVGSSNSEYGAQTMYVEQNLTNSTYTGIPLLFDAQLKSSIGITNDWTQGAVVGVHNYSPASRNPSFILGLFGRDQMDTTALRNNKPTYTLDAGLHLFGFANDAGTTNALARDAIHIGDHATLWMNTPTRSMFTNGLWITDTLGSSIVITNVLAGNAITVAANGGNVVINSGLQLGGGSTQTFFRIVSASLDFGSVAAGGQAEVAVNVPGATTNDVISIGCPAIVSNNLFYAGYVSVSETVTVRCLNNNLVIAIDPATQTFKVKVER